MNNPIRVMIAGIGGASLGTEICKSLLLADNYKIYGCDISKTAYGLYEKAFVETFKVNRNSYVSEVLSVCKEINISFLIPGGEQPMLLLNEAKNVFSAAGIQILSNSKEVIERCSNKSETFRFLNQVGIPIPQTTIIKNKNDIKNIGLPCIVKPAMGSGGSVSVFLAMSVDEAMIYSEFIKNNGNTPIAQQYICEEEGEFTIGVLSLPTGQVVGSIALRRVLDAKISIAYRGKGGVISSGYSQGHIGNYDNLCSQAEEIALAIKSCGPLNIQGRVLNGVLLPFEINPRFSASTYLRAMAGFNEIDMFIKYLIDGKIPNCSEKKTGWYLRSLTEKFIAEKELK
jgi:carbamoyl-phosphate synthase large subunit